LSQPAAALLLPFCLPQMKQQLEQFKVKLQAFAEKHRHQIAKDPQFRKHFNELCMKVGVDPLSCSHLFSWFCTWVGDPVASY
jgi:ESCRT-II complex subunit VPS22